MVYLIKTSFLVIGRGFDRWHKPKSVARNGSRNRSDTLLSVCCHDRTRR